MLKMITVWYKYYDDNDPKLNHIEDGKTAGQRMSTQNQLNHRLQIKKLGEKASGRENMHILMKNLE
ncbi:hypothetical protein ACI43K_07550 [Bacillus subtilis]|uniref:hypothetical protein n=1 Tax=Bacillus subtilis TaxID=1423 RepID=UPI001366E27B|nr:hypothetical protein [Bacillus subtilis]QHL55648.1 hypothetical protein C7M23_02773 [Bacillus subtilis]